MQCSSSPRRKSTPWRAHSSPVGLPRVRRHHSSYDRTGKRRRDYVDPAGLARLKRRMMLRNELSDQGRYSQKNIDALRRRMASTDSYIVHRLNPSRITRHF